MPFLRPVDPKFPISAEYGKWGPWWGFHITGGGTWIPGKVDGKGQHKGIDFATPEGSEVLAMENGVVTHAGWENLSDTKQGFGLRIRQQIECDGKKLTLVYGHLSALTIRPGHQVIKGDRIAYSGNTGKTTGPHLHIELTDGRGQYFPILFDNLPQKPLENPPENA
jgi:murein DD-endopeptidase MepM/ murein hydrolase activator NlpD